MSNDLGPLRDIAQRLTRAHLEKDAQAILSCYAPDPLVYDLAPPLGQRGFGRAELEAWLATWDGPITLDIRALQSRIDGDLAIMSGLNRLRGRKIDGGTVDLWFRITTALVRQQNAWRIVHEHASVPFHMDGSDRAAIDLTPPDVLEGPGGFNVESPARG